LLAAVRLYYNGSRIDRDFPPPQIIPLSEALAKTVVRKRGVVALSTDISTTQAKTPPANANTHKPPNPAIAPQTLTPGNMMYPVNPFPFGFPMGPAGTPNNFGPMMSPWPNGPTPLAPTFAAAPPSPTIAAKRLKLLSEVKEHLDLLKQFEGVISPEELAERKRKLYQALPPAPPAAVPGAADNAEAVAGIDTIVIDEINNATDGNLPSP
jgi:hypothetical protein